MTVSLKRALRSTLVALATLTALTVPGAVSASAAVPSPAPSGDITVEVVGINGSGCKLGTAKVYMSPDNTWFRVRYYDYVARTGGSSSSTEWRKTCQLGLLVHIPQGFTFAIAESDSRGKANLKDDASAQFITSYYFQGSSDTDSLAHDLAGPLHGTWTASDIVPVLTWAPCSEQRILNVKTELRVYGGASNANNTVSLSSTEDSVDTLFHIGWKAC
jgi:hypothetical protein